MKRIILLVAILSLSNTAFSEVRPEYGGSWFNPSQSGHGFSIEVLSPERSIAYWYTYDPWGNSIFLVADGRNVGNRIEATVYFYQGMVFGEFDPDTNGRWKWGTLTITFDDCTHATLQYDSVLEYESGASFGSGQMPLTRLASMDGYRCYDYPLAGVYAGYYFGPDNFSYIGMGFVSEEGELNFGSSSGLVIIADLNADEGTTGDLTATGSQIHYYADGYMDIRNFSLDGGFDQDVFWGDTLTSEYLRLTKQVRDTTRSISMSDLSGNWIAHNIISGQSLSVTIKTDGSYSVTDQNGCFIDGRISIPNPQLNVLKSSATVTGCAVASGTFTGNGAFFINGPEVEGDDSMQFVGWNGSDDVTNIEFTRP